MARLTRFRAILTAEATAPSAFSILLGSCPAALSSVANAFAAALMRMTCPADVASSRIRPSSCNFEEDPVSQTGSGTGSGLFSSSQSSFSFFGGAHCKTCQTCWVSAPLFPALSKCLLKFSAASDCAFDEPDNTACSRAACKENCFFHSDNDCCAKGGTGGTLQPFRKSESRGAGACCSCC